MLVRIDRGKDFPSRTVSEALGAVASRTAPLPPYGSYLKGTIETINWGSANWFAICWWSNLYREWSSGPMT